MTRFLLALVLLLAAFPAAAHLEVHPNNFAIVPGQSVKITAGSKGDISHPIGASDAVAVPAGTSDSWVRYTTPCGVGTALVWYPPAAAPRTRAVRH